MPVPVTGETYTEELRPVWADREKPMQNNSSDIHKKRGVLRPPYNCNTRTAAAVSVIITAYTGGILNFY